MLAAAQPAKLQVPVMPAAEISAPEIPKLASPPKLADFEGMEPGTDLARSMLKIDKFVQRDPHDA